MQDKRVIIIGATSGIGRALAIELVKLGCTVGATGRRTELLESLKQDLGDRLVSSTFDLADTQDSEVKFNDLVSRMGGADIVIINSGTGSIDPDYPLRNELNTTSVNVTGFTTIANLAYHYFKSKSAGHIVGISSVAAVRGGSAASYNASKAYVSSYLEGLAVRAHHLDCDLTITDVRPGFVDTAMAQGDGQFWVASPQVAAKQIIDAIEKRRRIVYVTKRWRLVAILMSVLPFGIYKRVMR